MRQLKYTVIKTKKQYIQYCDALEKLVFQNKKHLTDEIELLTFIIEKWDKEQSPANKLNPIELLKTLMIENGLKAKDLVSILAITKGTVSKILNYQKGLSKNSIRKLSNHFKVSQEAFNRPYSLKDTNILLRVG